MRLAWLGLLSLVCANASAQSVVEVPMSAGALIYLNKEGRVHRCGMRITGVQIGNGDVRLFDTSLILTDDGNALAKVAGSSGKQARGVEGLEATAVHGGWFKAAGQPATLPIDGYLPGDTPSSRIFAPKFEPAAAVINSIGRKEPIQVAISWDGVRDVIYAGTPTLEIGQAKQLVGCIDELIANIQAKDR